MKNTIHCSVGVIKNCDAYFLIQRQKYPYHGYFEFPGGKIEKEEQPLEALQRELFEELNIRIQKADFVYKITHEYKEFRVCLYIYRIKKYKGDIKSSNKQEHIYCKKDSFKDIQCLESTYRIIKLLSLPKYLAISKPSNKIFPYNLTTLDKSLGILIRLRNNNNPYKNNFKNMVEFSQTCQNKNIGLIIDHPYERECLANYNGIHFKSDYLVSMENIPNNFKYYSCSCHNVNEINKANSLNFDYIIISPVKESKYPNQKCLGWEGFEKLSNHANMPTFALGGISKEDLFLSHKNGGYGVAGIRKFW